MSGCWLFRYGTGVIAALAPLLLSCMVPGTATGDGRDLPVRVIHSSLVCATGAKGFRVTWIADRAALRKALNAERPMEIGHVPPTAPPVDFRTEIVLRIEMGMRPTTGYGFDPRTVHAVVAADTLTVNVTTLAPGPGAIVAQMVTRPCILVQIPKGAYHRVRVRNQHGEVLGVVSVRRHDGKAGKGG